jgi:uncharacterized membrane protein YGL010W
MADYRASIFNMQDSQRNQLRHALEIGLAFAPWVASLFLLYWLQYGQIWTTETAHRGKISVAILIVGMGLSFLVHSYFTKRRPS